MKNTERDKKKEKVNQSIKDQPKFKKNMQTIHCSELKPILSRGKLTTHIAYRDAMETVCIGTIAKLEKIT